MVTLSTQDESVKVMIPPVAVRPDGAGGTREVDLTAEWPVVTVHSAVSKATGVELTSASTLEEVSAVCARHHVTVPRGATAGKLVMELYEALVEKQTEFPTFYCDFPIEVSPLARRNDNDPSVTDRFELFIGGREIANAYSELNDAEDQAERFAVAAERATGRPFEPGEIDDHLADEARARQVARLTKKN